MAKHVNHFDAQTKISNAFKTISNRNSDNEDDLSLKAQLQREVERKQLKQQQPKTQVKQQRRFAGWVVVKYV